MDVLLPCSDLYRLPECEDDDSKVTFVRNVLNDFLTSGVFPIDVDDYMSPDAHKALLDLYDEWNTAMTKKMSSISAGSRKKLSENDKGENTRCTRWLADAFVAAAWETNENQGYSKSGKKGDTTSSARAAAVRACSLAPYEAPILTAGSRLVMRYPPDEDDGSIPSNNRPDKQSASPYQADEYTFSEDDRRKAQAIADTFYKTYQFRGFQPIVLDACTELELVGLRACYDQQKAILRKNCSNMNADHRKGLAENEIEMLTFYLINDLGAIAETAAFASGYDPLSKFFKDVRTDGKSMKQLMSDDINHNPDIIRRRAETLAKDKFGSEAANDLLS